MATVTVEIPDELLPDAATPEERTREAKLHSAMVQFARGRLSQGRAAELAGVSRAAFIQACAGAGIQNVDVDLDEIRREARRG
jgi:predicted HTH domain antitoxin